MRLTSGLCLASWLTLCLAASGADPHFPVRSPAPSDLAHALPRGGKRPAPTTRPHIPTASALYLRSLQSDAKYSYRGRQITTYWRSGHAEAVLISHRAPRRRRIDYLAPDAERGRSVVTDGAQEWQYDPRTRHLLHRSLDRDAQAAADAAQNYDLLRANYVLGVLPLTRTWADRKAYVVTITRKSDRTPARKLWVDAVTGLVLKRENYREDGKLALTVAYSDINFRVPLPQTLFDLAALGKRSGVRRVEQRASSEVSLPLTAVRRQLSGAAVAPPDLNGYHLVSAAQASDGRTQMLHLRYSDGLILVSLFEQRRTHPRRPTRVPNSMRPTRVGRWDGHVTHRAALTAVNWDAPALNLTLMGELSESSLQALALAVDASADR